MIKTVLILFLSLLFLSSLNGSEDDDCMNCKKQTGGNPLGGSSSQLVSSMNSNLESLYNKKERECLTYGNMALLTMREVDSAINKAAFKIARKEIDATELLPFTDPVTGKPMVNSIHHYMPSNWKMEDIDGALLMYIVSNDMEKAKTIDKELRKKISKLSPYDISQDPEVNKQFEKAVSCYKELTPILNSLISGSEAGSERDQKYRDHLLALQMNEYLLKYNFAGLKNMRRAMNYTLENLLKDSERYNLIHSGDNKKIVEGIKMTAGMFDFGKGDLQGTYDVARLLGGSDKEVINPGKEYIKMEFQLLDVIAKKGCLKSMGYLARSEHRRAKSGFTPDYRRSLIYAVIAARGGDEDGKNTLAAEEEHGYYNGKSKGKYIYGDVADYERFKRLGLLNSEQSNLLIDVNDSSIKKAGGI